jgi:hypothetical protein
LFSGRDTGLNFDGHGAVCKPITTRNQPFANT